MLYADDRKKGKRRAIEVSERLKWMLVCRDLNAFYGTRYTQDDLLDMDATFLDDLIETAEAMRG